MLQSGAACDEVREHWGVAVAVSEWYVTGRQQSKSACGETWLAHSSCKCLQRVGAWVGNSECCRDHAIDRSEVSSSSSRGHVRLRTVAR